MENLFSYLAGSLIRRTARPAFKRYLIGRCSSLLPHNDKTVYCKLTKEGERVYFYETTVGGVSYGLITVNMKEVYSLAQGEKILIHYLNRIRKPFGIAYNLQMEIEQTPQAVELTDYWQDEAGTDWKIRGFCNGKILAVLYVKNIGRCQVSEHEAFLNGFRFSSRAKASK